LPQVLETAAIFNEATPTFRVPADSRPWSSGLAIAEPGVAITSVKRRFDDSGLAVRIVEQLGEARTVTVTLPPGTDRVRTSNLLEDADTELAVKAGQMQLPVRAFGIHTLLLD
jgi:alpha-mannosidase